LCACVVKDALKVITILQRQFYGAFVTGSTKFMGHHNAEPYKGGQLWVFFDLEATGLDPLSDHVTQLASSAYFTNVSQPFSALHDELSNPDLCSCEIFWRNFRFQEASPDFAIQRGEFSCRVRPGVPVSSGAQAVTGIGTEALAGYGKFSEQVTNQFAFRRSFQSHMGHTMGRGALRTAQYWLAKPVAVHEQDPTK